MADPVQPSQESTPPAPEQEPELQEQEQPPEEPAPADPPEEPADENDGEVASDSEPQKHKRVGGFQRTIQRLERQIAERDALLAQALARPQQDSGTPQPALTPEQKAAQDFRAMVREQAKQLLAEERAQSSAQARQAEFDRRTGEVRARYADFDEVLADAAHLPVSQAVQQALLTSEAGPEIMYRLAKNPAELARLSALPPFDAAREIGRLEAKASGAAPQKTNPANRPPAPPSRVSGTAQSTRRLEDLPLAEYKKAMRSGRR